MSEVLKFASRVLEREGALVEPASAGAITAVLPEELQQAFEVDEFCILSEGEAEGVPCGYGSEVLGKIAKMAVGDGRTVALRAELPDLAARGPECFAGVNLTFRVVEARSERLWTMVAIARCWASADEQREGIAAAAVLAPGGVPVPIPDLDTLPIVPVRPEEIPPEPLRAAFPRLIASLRRQAVGDLDGFREAMARRRRRDSERLRRYFDEVAKDLRRRIRRRGGELLKGKLDSLPAELDRRLAELRADSVVRVRLELVGIAAVSGPGIAAKLEVRRRKHTRILEAYYSGIAGKWVGLRCDGCGISVTSFAMCDEAAHVLCGECWASCGTGGHRRCFRCAKKPERAPWAETARIVPQAGLARPEAADTAGGEEAGAREDATPAAPSRPTPAGRKTEAVRRALSTSPETRVTGGPRKAPSSARGADPRTVELIQILQASPDALSSQEIQSILGIDAPTLRRLLAPLIGFGFVGRVGNRRGTRYFWISQDPHGTSGPRQRP